ncbi:hypothetical protein ACFQZE_23695 [Paenibacillus sp. GCM10027627]
MSPLAAVSCSSLTGNDSWSADVAIDQLLRSAGRSPEELMANSTIFS